MRSFLADSLVPDVPRTWYMARRPPPRKRFATLTLFHGEFTFVQCLQTQMGSNIDTGQDNQHEPC